MAEFTVSNEYFSVRDTLECGQFFRFKKLGENRYEVFSLGNRALVSENGDTVKVECGDPEYFRNFFDLGTDYKGITTRLAAFPELTEAVNFGKRLRILRQDFYETVISFIVSANNSIKRIQGIIERLCERYGEKKNGYFAFPTASELQKATVAELKEIGLGYRAEYIYETCRTFGGVADDIRKMNADGAHDALLKLKGIGPKVADCITLFGLRLTRSYPVDTWIFKASSTPELDTPKKVREYYVNRYGDDAGYAQQYVFYHARTKKF